MFRLCVKSAGPGQTKLVGRASILLSHSLNICQMGWTNVASLSTWKSQDKTEYGVRMAVRLWMLIWTLHLKYQEFVLVEISRIANVVVGLNREVWVVEVLRNARGLLDRRWWDSQRRVHRVKRRRLGRGGGWAMGIWIRWGEDNQEGREARRKKFHERTTFISSNAWD